MKIEVAVEETYLKKDPLKQASELGDSEKVLVKKGRVYQTEVIENENDDDVNPSSHGHMQIEISHGAGKWYIWPEHWRLESHVIVVEPPAKLPEWNEVDWTKWESPVSRYFTVGEVCLRSEERRPRADGQWSERDIKQNIIKVARHMDEIREWWGSPLAINSWLRPWKVNTRIGSSAPNHPSGTGVDFRPVKGSIWELQKRFKAEWYDTGRWNSGYGLGADKGFQHIDLRGRRIWNY